MLYVLRKFRMKLLQTVRSLALLILGEIKHGSASLSAARELGGQRPLQHGERALPHVRRASAADRAKVRQAQSARHTPFVQHDSRQRTQPALAAGAQQGSITRQKREHGDGRGRNEVWSARPVPL